MATKRIAKNHSRRVGRKGQILNQFFNVLIKNQETKATQAEEKQNG